MDFSHYTLGCRLNISETENIVSKFLANGYDIVDFDLPTDISFINTCTVTGQAGVKSRNIISRALKNSKKAVFVSGCHYKEVSQEFDDEKIIVIDNKKKGHTFDIIQSYINGEMIKIDTLPLNSFNYDNVSKTKTKAFVKIQDGCDNKCSFCIIPITRGVAISRDNKDILYEINSLIELGYKEIVLTGINLGRYNYENISFYSLVSDILKSIPKNVRLSISSLEPYGIDENFLDLFNKHPNFIRHIHLCLQSGSDKVLLKMRREYLYADFLKIVKQLKAIDKKFNISTDIIVGYPGETDQDFEKTVKAIKECEFSHIHIFPYSDRQDTISSRAPDKIDNNIKKQRISELNEIAKQLSLSYKGLFINEIDEVLFIKKINIDNIDYWLGDSKYYQKVMVKSQNNLKNSLISVNIHSNDEEYLIADIL